MSFKKSFLLNSFIIITNFVFFNSGVFAAEPSTYANGFNGTIILGGQIVVLKSNMIYGFSNYNDFTEEKNDDPSESTEKQIIINPVISPRLAYTFENNTKIFFLVDSLEPYSSNDSGVILGISSGSNNTGNIGISGIYGVPSSTWIDPYSIDRETTKTGCFGVLTEWENFFGSNLNLKYMFRKITIEDEKSGEAEGLLDDEIDLLNREGKHHRVGAEYSFFMANYTNILKFGFDYDIYNLQGDAMSFDRYTGRVDYIYMNRELRYNIILSASYSYSKNKEENPIFDKTIRTDKFGGAITFIKEQFLYDLDFMVNIQSYKKYTNQDFYDEHSLSAALGLIYHI